MSALEPIITGLLPPSCRTSMPVCTYMMPCVESVTANNKHAQTQDRRGSKVWTHTLRTHTTSQHFYCRTIKRLALAAIMTKAAHCCLLQGCLAVLEYRFLLTYLQSEWREVLGSRLRNNTGDVAVASVHDVRELLTKQRSGLCDSAKNHTNCSGIEVLLHQSLNGGGRVR